VRVFRQNFTLEDAIGSHACSLEASRRVTNGIPLGCPLFLLVHTVNCVATLKACHSDPVVGAALVRDLSVFSAENVHLPGDIELHGVAPLTALPSLCANDMPRGVSTLSRVNPVKYITEGTRNGIPNKSESLHPSHHNTTKGPQSFGM
jgi:hypothetical protein